VKCATEREQFRVHAVYVCDECHRRVRVYTRELPVTPPRGWRVVEAEHFCDHPDCRSIGEVVYNEKSTVLGLRAIADAASAYREAQHYLAISEPGDREPAKVALADRERALDAALAARGVRA
jgi:hypothetical protein